MIYGYMIKYQHIAGYGPPHFREDKKIFMIGVGPCMWVKDKLQSYDEFLRKHANPNSGDQLLQWGFVETVLISNSIDLKNVSFNNLFEIKE